MSNYLNDNAIANLLGDSGEELSDGGKVLPDDGVANVESIATPGEYFEKYFTQELFDQFALATSQYYMTKNLSDPPQISSMEIKMFFGIHGLMGCFKVPRIKLYWNTRFKYDPISSAMTRERFFMLRTNLHIINVFKYNEAEENKKNRLWRIQPVIDAIRNRCLALPRDAKNYSIDEQMIPFTGRAGGLKVVVRNKPRPAGLKNLVVTSSAGLVMDFEINQGLTTPLPDAKNFNVGPAIVLRLARSLPEGSFLYFDRYFTNVPLMKELLNRKLDGTGTIMLNRFNSKKDNKLTFKKDHVMSRGEAQQGVSSDGKLSIVKWKDNKTVLMISTAFGVDPKTNVSRWDKKNKKFINVSCPDVVKNYNAKMGGVDICDQMMETYRTWFKTRKWTLKVILHLFDLSIVNSWFEYRQHCKALNISGKDVMDLLAFRLSISEYLLGGPPRKRCREDDDVVFATMPSSSKYFQQELPSLDRRMDGYNHWAIVDNLTAPRRCRVAECRSKSRTRCTKCNIYLCLNKDKNCFFKFHNK